MLRIHVISQCKVAWTKICRPKELGGLGVVDLERFGRALRLRWPWHAWRSPDKPWVGMELACDATDMALFHALTIVQVGDGRTADFWCSSWLQGTAPRNVAPSLFRDVRPRRRSIRAALMADAWIEDIRDHIQPAHLGEFVRLWRLVHTVQLTDGPDLITWKASPDGVYSARSAYLAQFAGSTQSDLGPIVWEPWATPRIKLFGWLLLQRRVYTADRLQRRGWPNSYLFGSVVRI
ncbi:hypothetical protein ACP70R_038293 [Stipagrostis hirtigluma subsp. patula]